MKNVRYRAITIKSLDEACAKLQPTQPSKGWLLAVREGLGLSRAAIAKRLSLTPSAVQSFEISEARGTIALQSLRKLADALDCEVVVKLVPKDGKTFTDLAALHDPDLVNLRATEHSMSLESQGSGDLEQRIRDHFKS
jgi:predicted DNA-binding mobile mystery protein A